ncbi:MAG TPA: TIGR00282 family metallophosphoesterase [Alphaproteobacteria bacterium]|nr:TIGR00282 family metallophosphoesterase [Alphaproteobacteria bacterium]
MKLLVCGDVVGRAGRNVVCDQVPLLRKALGLDFVVVNGENAAGGFGITGEICGQFYAAGVDAITTGNHVWDQRETASYILRDPKLLRPHNFPPATPGRGVGVFPTASGKRVVILHVMMQLFMEPLDNPFTCLEQQLATHKLGRNADLILVDAHGEATSEKVAIGHFCDGRVSAVIGTHSHIPTADAQILPGGTAYQTDLGMCGDYDSVIGMKKDVAVARFVNKLRGERLSPAEGEATLCAAYIETDDATGLATHISPLRLGGRLQPHWPLPAPMGSLKPPKF